MFVTLLDHRAKSLGALARCVDVIHDSRHVGRGSQEVIQEVVENLIFGLWGQREIGESIIGRPGRTCYTVRSQD